MTWADMVTDVYQTAKDVFLQREGLKNYEDRQAVQIESQQVMAEASNQAALAQAKVKASTIAYIGGGLLLLAIFVGIYKSVT